VQSDWSRSTLKRPTEAVERTLRRTSGARLARISSRPGAHAPEHEHDWPILSLYVMGGHRKLHDAGELLISRPSVVLHPAGVSHANLVSDAGFEQLDIEFDPSWVSLDEVGSSASLRWWIGGPVAHASRDLVRQWRRQDQTDTQLRKLTSRFLAMAINAPEARIPAWFDDALALIEGPDPALTSAEIARRLKLNTAWFTQAYRAAAGEGIAETRQRRRVEHALICLDGGAPSADAAAAAGFCDQSHMIRAFDRLLGRTPAKVQMERARGAPRREVGCRGSG